MNAVNFIGRLIPGIISDTVLGPLQTMIPAAFLSSIFVFLWLMVRTKTALLIVGCGYGFTAGGVQSLFAAAVRGFAGGTNNPTRIGVVFIAISIATLTGAPLGGQLVELANGDYLYAQVFSGVTIMFGASLLTLARFVKTGLRPAMM